MTREWKEVVDEHADQGLTSSRLPANGDPFNDFYRNYILGLKEAPPWAIFSLPADILREKISKNPNNFFPMLKLSISHLKFSGFMQMQGEHINFIGEDSNSPLSLSVARAADRDSCFS